MSPEARFLWTKVLIALGLTFTSFGLTLGLASYVLPSWFVYNSQQSGTPWNQQVRTIGIFQECLLDRTAAVSADPPYVSKGGCIENDVGQYPSIYNGNDNTYLMNLRLKLSQLILHGISLVFTLVLLILGFGIFVKLCGDVRDTIYYLRWRRAFGLVLILTVLVMAASPAIGTARFLMVFIANGFSAPFALGSMYIVAWVSAGCYLIAAFFFLITVQLGSRLAEQKYQPDATCFEVPANNGNNEKTNMPIFFTPLSASKYGRDNFRVTPNDTTSPGLLPRYNIN